VEDDSEHATFFPQIGLMSDNHTTRNVYWRCVVCFFATSLAVNPSRSHILFTNTYAPVVDGVDINDFFEQSGIRIIRIPITY